LAGSEGERARLLEQRLREIGAMNDNKRIADIAAELLAAAPPEDPPN